MNRDKKFAFNVQLAILGFLREKEFHGYELKKLMERFMGPWSDIKFGSIYYALEKLTKEGLAEPVREEKAGAQPARTIYRVTAKGRDAFREMLADSFTTMQPVYHMVDVSLFFAGCLDPDRLITLLRRRAEKNLEMVEELRATKEGHIENEIAQLLIEHSIMHLETESKFLLDVAEVFTRKNPFSDHGLLAWLENIPAPKIPRGRKRAGGSAR